MNKKIFSKILNQKSSASAILVSIVVFGAISIIAFGSAYMSIINMSKGSSLSDKMKAEKMIESGIERFKYEFYFNDFDVNSVCSQDIFSYSSSDLSYNIYCDNSSGQNLFFVSGNYKNTEFSKKIKIKGLFENCGDYVFYDDYFYKTVEIGNQCWFAENLKYLPSVHLSSDISEVSDRYYVYGYEGTDVAVAKEVNNYNIHGVLYNRLAANTSCPSGWSLPTYSNYFDLINYLGGESLAGKEMKSVSYNGNNNSEFNIFLSGHLYVDYFARIDAIAEFWSLESYLLSLDLGDGAYIQDVYLNSNGASIRCIKN